MNGAMAASDSLPSCSHNLTDLARLVSIVVWLKQAYFELPASTLELMALSEKPAAYEGVVWIQVIPTAVLGKGCYENTE